MEGETGKVMLIEEMAGKQEDLHSERASSTTRKFQAVVTCVHTPAKFWARIGEVKSLKNFEGYLATLNEWCSLQKGSPTELPKVKSYIAIKLDSLQWQRAQVLKIISDERISVFCIDTGETVEVSVEQICAKQMPLLMQQPTQAIQCSLADVTSIRPGNWSKEAIERFRCLVQDHTDPVYVEFQTIKQMEGQMCGEILLFVSDHTVPERIRSVGRILSNKGLAQYTGDDDDDDDISVTNKRTLFAAKGATGDANADSVINKDVNADSVTNKDGDEVMKLTHTVTHMVTHNSESSDDVVVEESSSEDERPLIANSCSSNVMVNVTNDVMADNAVESEQVIGPSHLVENKNSFNIISRAANYSSSSSSSDEGEDAWDDSLLAPVKPKPVAGIMAKADVEKNMQKRKAFQAKFNEFLSTPLPPPAFSDRHPFGSRGKRGSRRGAKGVGRYATGGRGNHPTGTSSQSGDRGNQTRGDGQYVKTLMSSPQQPFPQQQFPQPQFPQQQFPQQQFPQQQFPQQQFPQQQFPQQQFPQQQFSQQQFSQRQFPQRQFLQQPRQQFFQQSSPHSFPQQQLPGQQLPPSKQDQPWQHNHSPKLRQFLTNKSPIKSTPQVNTNVTSIDQLDEKGMRNEYEWQKWMVERSVKKALEGLSEEAVNDFSSQLKKILSDSSAVTLNKFPSSKGATWVLIKTVCTNAVDKPAQCSKAFIALKEIYNSCMDEMTRLFPQILQECSEQVLEEITSTNSQCGSYSDFVCHLHRSTANDDTSNLHLLINSSLDHLLKFWTNYALDGKIGEVESGGCADIIIKVFTNIVPHMALHNRMLLEQCCKMVRSLVLSSLPVQVRESLLDFYLIITKYQQQPSDTVSVDNAANSLSSLSVAKATDHTGSATCNPGESNQFKSDQSSVKPDQSSVKPDQSSVKLDQSSVKLDQSSVKLDQSSVKPNQSSVKPDQSSVKPDQSSIKPDQSITEPDQSIIRPNQSLDQPSVKPDQGLIGPDQANNQMSHLTTTTLDAPASHPTVVMATKSHNQDISSMISSHNTPAVPVDQPSPPIYVADPYCSVTAMLNALNLSHLLDNFKAAIIQDSVLSCDPSGLKEAMKEAGIPSGAVLSIIRYLNTQDNTSGIRMQYPAAPQQSYYQFPVQHTYPSAAAYSLQPSVHAAYLQQQQPHPLAAAPQFTSVPSPIASQQMSSMPTPSLSQQVLSPVGIPSPAHHPLQQQPVSLVSGWTDGNKVTPVATGPRP